MNLPQTDRTGLDPGTRVEADALQDYAVSSRLEWVIANNAGGYASGSLSGASTRRYHGLLVASAGSPPTRRVSLSRLEETVRLDDRVFELGANQYPGAVHPQGFAHLVRYDAWPAPTFLFQLDEGVFLRRRYWMTRGRNVTHISYTWLADRAAALALAPLVCWKDHHAEFREMSGFPLGLQASEGALDVCLADGGPWLHVRGPFGRPEPAGYWHRRIEHERERERGFDWHEDLYCPAVLPVTLAPGETVTLAAGCGELPEEDPRAWPRLARRASAVQRQARPRDPVEAALAAAADAFCLYAPASRPARRRAVGVTAGFPWFGDWGRDTMISLPGLLLATGRARECGDVLEAYGAWLSDGMLPNRFPDTGGPPEYNTADATLWFVEAVRRCVDLAPDGTELAQTLWPTVMEVINWHARGTRHGICVDPADRLLRAGGPDTNLTWMDARVDGRAVTPRAGKPVEVNALWCNALHAAARIAERLGEPADGLHGRAAEAARAFRSRFVRPDGQGLFDVVDGPDGDDASIRPNQVFAVSLPSTALEPWQARSVIDTVKAHLLTPCGLRTLSPTDPRYVGRYEGGPAQRDGAYHQGTVWPWLLGPFALAHYRAYGDREAALGLLEPLAQRLGDAAVGFLPEVYDGDPPHRPGGCVAQAWSVAETLRAWRALAHGDGLPQRP